MRVEANADSGLSFDRDSRHLLLRGSATFHVFNLTTGGLVGPIKYLNTSNPTFSPDGSLVATGLDVPGDDRVVRLRRSDTGEPAGDLRIGPKVRLLTFSPDGARMVVAAAGDDLGVWDLNPQRLLAKLPGTRGTFGIRFAPDGRRVLARGAGGSVDVYDPTTGRHVFGPVRCTGDDTAFRPGGDHLAIPDGRAVRLVDLADGTERGRIEVGRQVSEVAFDPTGERAVVVTESRARVYDVRTGQPAGPMIGRTTLHNMGAWFDPTGRRLVVAGQADESGLWDWRTGRQLVTVDAPQWDLAPKLALSPDGRTLAVCFAGDDFTTLQPVPPAE